MPHAPKHLHKTRDVVAFALQFTRGDVLDLGAGTAKYRGMIQEHAASYKTFDMISGDHIDVVGDILNTGFADGSFDTIFCTQVFEHIPKPWLAVGEIKRLLRPGGVVIVTAPFMQPYHADPHDYFRYTPNGLRSLFDSGEFEIVTAGEYSLVWVTLVESIRHAYFSPYGKKRRGAAKLFKWFFGIAEKLDRRVRNRRIYSNSYLIARKKSR